MEIGIFDALRIYRNPLSFYVRIERDVDTGKYGASFCLKKDAKTVEVVRSWPPFSSEVTYVIKSVESLLKPMLVHGHRAYCEFGTYLFNHYNPDMELLSDESVLTEERVNIIIFNLTFQAMQFLHDERSPFVEYEVLVGAIAPQENACALH